MQPHKRGIEIEKFHSKPHSRYFIAADLLWYELFTHRKFRRCVYVRITLSVIDVLSCSSGESGSTVSETPSFSHYDDNMKNICFVIRVVCEGLSVVVIFL